MNKYRKFLENQPEYQLKILTKDIINHLNEINDILHIYEDEYDRLSLKFKKSLVSESSPILVTNDNSSSLFINGGSIIPLSFPIVETNGEILIEPVLSFSTQMESRLKRYSCIDFLKNNKEYNISYSIDCKLSGSYIDVEQSDKEINKILETLCDELRSRFPFLEIKQKSHRLSRNTNSHFLNMFINSSKL